MSSGSLIKADGEIMTMPRTEIQMFCPNCEFKVRHDVLLVKEGGGVIHELFYLVKLLCQNRIVISYII